MIISESMQISDTPSFDVPFQHIAARSWVLWRQGKKMYHFSSSWKTQDNFIEIEVLPVAWQQFQVNIFIRVQSAQSAGLFQDLPGSQGKWKGHVSNVNGTLQVGGLSKRQLAEIRQLLRSGRPGSMSGSFFFGDWNCRACPESCVLSWQMQRVWSDEHICFTDVDLFAVQRFSKYLKLACRSPPEAVKRILAACWLLLHCQRFKDKPISAVRFDEVQLKRILNYTAKWETFQDQKRLTKRNRSNTGYQTRWMSLSWIRDDLGSHYANWRFYSSARKRIGRDASGC